MAEKKQQQVRRAPLPVLLAAGCSLLQLPMLAADKLLLQSNVKQRSIELREKELNLFNSNFAAVGTQAAIMAGFTLTSFVEIDLPPTKRWAKAMLHFFVTSSICVNFVCVAMVTFVTVWGSGKALRGQDGSMDYAVDEMNAERSAFTTSRMLLGCSFIFGTFAVGVLTTLGCLFSAAWVLMETEIAMIASVLIIGTMYMVVSEARRIAARFRLEPNENVTFEDLHVAFPRLPSSSSKKRFSDDPEDFPLLPNTVKDTKA